MENCSTIAKSAVIHASVKIEHPVQIGARAEFRSGSIGRYSFINNNTVIYSNVHVGRFSTFARGCQVGGVEHPIHHLTTSFFGLSEHWFPNDPLAASIVCRRRNSPYPGRRRPDRITIGNDVWVGAAALVLKGVTIGDGAVIGAGAVITKDVPPYALVAGNPARVIRYRFEPRTIDRLLAVRWWNLDPQEIAKLPMADVDACLEVLAADAAA